MSDIAKDDLMPHFIYCYGKYGPDVEQLKILLQSKMRKYGIQSAILTMLFMFRKNLITKEKAKAIAIIADGNLKNYPERPPEYKRSINDDLESYFQKFLNQEKIKIETEVSLFLPKLTEDELKLVEKKNENHMRSYLLGLFGADIDAEEMKLSNSRDKYVHSGCYRKTIYLDLESNENSSLEESESDWGIYHCFAYV